MSCQILLLSYHFVKTMAIPNRMLQIHQHCYIFLQFQNPIIQSPQPILIELNQPSSSPLPWLGLPPSTASHSYPLLHSFPCMSASSWSAWILERSYLVSRPQIVLAATRSLYLHFPILVSIQYPRISYTRSKSVL